MKTPAQTDFWRRWFGAPSQELAAVAETTRDAMESIDVLKDSASQLANQAVRVALVAKMLRGAPGSK